MSVQTLITNYEAHLEANWTREGERKSRYDAWRSDVMFTGVNYVTGECEPTASAKRTLTQDPCKGCDGKGRYEFAPITELDGTTTYPTCRQCKGLALPHTWMQDRLTADNIEETYSKPLPS